jgi:Phosphatidylinositol 3- and 4-kinase/FYVE zinc finger
MSSKDPHKKKNNNDIVQESIERSMRESDMSYSAYLDDRHHEYTREARKIRTKRRSGKLDPYSTDGSSESPMASPITSQPASPRIPIRQTEINSNAPIELSEIVSPDSEDKKASSEEQVGSEAFDSESKDSSDVSIIDVGGHSDDEQIIAIDYVIAPESVSANIQTKSADDVTPNILDDRLRPTHMRAKSTSPQMKAFHRVNYESDITSDDRGILREFGDSEMPGPNSSIKNFKNNRNDVVRMRTDTRPTEPVIADANLTSPSVLNIDMESVLMREIEEYSALLSSDELSTSQQTDSKASDQALPEIDILSALEDELSKSIMDAPDSSSGKSKKSKKKKKKVVSSANATKSRGARRMIKWVNDESVDTCYGCSEPFGYLNRKHHCRLCGRIFCQKCSRYSTILPMDILKKIPDRPGSYADYLFGDDPNSKVRVCGDCFKYASDIIRIKKVIKVFEICGFNLIELGYLAQFSEDWKKAAEFCIDRFREIQYKLSIEDLTPIEKKYIWINRNLLSKHSRWMVLLFKSCDLTDPKKVAELQYIVSSPKRISCWKMQCSRFCSDEIQLGDMLDLVKYNNNDPIISNYIIDCVSRIDGNTLMDYLPFLVTNAVNNTFMIDILLEKAQNDFTLMTHVYWCIKAFIPDKTIRRNSIIQALRFIKEMNNDEFSTRFKIMIKNEKLNLNWIKLQNEKTNRKIVIPVCPTRNFDSIEVDKIKVMDSNSRPVIIPFRDGDKRKLIMYKEDDIRKDYVILGIINIVHRLLNSEMNMNIDTVKYRVMPTSDDSGYIEIVENAQTIYDIIQGQTIQNYILNHNEAATVSEIKERFIKSTALYCVISYLFGFGDRHLENIMISETGLLFHIDFGYILGQDPKYTTNKSLRVTPEIINVIGGQNTDNYVKFSDCCTQIYTCLRRHVNLFSNLLSVVPLIDPYVSEDMIKHEIFDRFEVGENNLEAATHMDLKVRRDSGSFDYMIIDFLHRSKNTSIFKGLTYVKNSLLGFAYSNGT